MCLCAWQVIWFLNGDESWFVCGAQSCPAATVTKRHRPWLKQQIHSLTVWRLGVWDQGSAGLILPEATRENLSRAFPASGVRWQSGGSSACRSICWFLPASAHGTVRGCLSASTFTHFTRTPGHIGLGSLSPSDLNVSWSSTKTTFPAKVTSAGTGG